LTRASAHLNTVNLGLGGIRDAARLTKFSKIMTSCRSGFIFNPFKIMILIQVLRLLLLPIAERVDAFRLSLGLLDDAWCVIPRNQGLNNVSLFDF